MKTVLLAVSIVLLAMAARAQERAGNQNTGEFRSVDDDTYEKDFTKAQDSAKEAAKELTNFESLEINNAMDDDTEERALPPGYKVMGNSAMFDGEVSATNEKVEEPAEDRQKRAAKRVQLYTCPRTYHLLRWFPKYENGALHRVCFLPWAWYQYNYYTTCSGKCYLWQYVWTGVCRPTWYYFRWFRALCYHFKSHDNWPGYYWSWRWELVSLPQSCRCSTC